jgi:hypothetical protein
MKLGETMTKEQMNMFIEDLKSTLESSIGFIIIHNGLKNSTGICHIGICAEHLGQKVENAVNTLLKEGLIKQRCN